MTARSDRERLAEMAWDAIGFERIDMRYGMVVLQTLLIIGAARAEDSTPQDLDNQIAVSHDLPELEAVAAPRLQGTLRGAEDSRPATRTAESLAMEVKENQPKLSYLYKSWSVKGAEGIGGRKYNLTLTLSADGEVQKAVFKGPVNKDFLREAEAIVKTWNFSRVKAERPFVANLKNLDFLYRRELVVE